MNSNFELNNPNHLSLFSKEDLDIISTYNVNAAFFTIALLKKCSPNSDISPSIIFKFCKEVDKKVSDLIIYESMKSINNFRCDMQFNIVKSLGEEHPLFNEKENVLNFIDNMKDVETKLLRKTLVQCFEIWNKKEMFFIYQHPEFVLKWLRLKDYPLSKIPSIIINNDRLFYPIVKAYYPQLSEHQVQYEYQFLKKSLLPK